MPYCFWYCGEVRRRGRLQPRPCSGIRHRAAKTGFDEAQIDDAIEIAVKIDIGYLTLYLDKRTWSASSCPMTARPACAAKSRITSPTIRSRRLRARLAVTEAVLSAIGAAPCIGRSAPLRSATAGVVAEFKPGAGSGTSALSAGLTANFSAMPRGCDRNRNADALPPSPPLFVSIRPRPQGGSRDQAAACSLAAFQLHGIS